MAAESAEDLESVMLEILSTPTPSHKEGEIEAKRRADAALDGIGDAKEALRLWRDYEEEAVEILGEEPRGDEESDIDEQNE